ncbi:DegT/DnrJ/EryC1/StrS family aminotransferase [Alphaproteobacteria bacterium]|nr:DegT/DnrJ/EryC1/StrS family aminotransferase [Alphaproteobacteria bacterium]
MSEPDLGGRELEYLSRCVSENWISSAGPFIEEFEQKIAGFFGRKHAVSTSNGTSALTIALKAANIGPNDRVLVPDWTFSGSINSVLNMGAQPVLCDIDLNTFGISIDEVEKYLSMQTEDGDAIKAIMVVHPLGLPLDLKKLYALSEKYGVVIIEDAAGAFGSGIGGELIGSRGDFVTFSFNGNKVLTSAGGGMVLTDSDQVAQKMRLFRSNSAGVYDYHVPSFNHQMLNIAAAIGIAQFERHDVMLSRRKEIYETYVEQIPTDHSFFSIKSIPSNAEFNYWMFWLVFDNKLHAEEFILYMEDLQIQTRVFWKSLSISRAFDKVLKTDLTNSHALSGRVVTIPAGSALTDQNQSIVIDAIKSWVKSKAI